MTALVTTAEVKTYLGLTGSTHDDLIAELITLVSETIESYCNTYFESTATTEYVDGGHEYLIVPRSPIISITLIKDTTDDSTVSSSSYDYYPSEGMIYLKDSGLNGLYTWGAGRRRYRVTYHTGFAAVPEAVKWVAYDMIDRNLKLIPNSNNKGRWTQPDHVEVKEADHDLKLTSSNLFRLAPYRRIAI
jgi:hypothetical protein